MLHHHDMGKIAAEPVVAVRPVIFLSFSRLILSKTHTGVNDGFPEPDPDSPPQNM
jgi:hypothetical protein